MPNLLGPIHRWHYCALITMVTKLQGIPLDSLDCHISSGYYRKCFYGDERREGMIPKDEDQLLGSIVVRSKKLSFDRKSSGDVNS